VCVAGFLAVVVASRLAGQEAIPYSAPDPTQHHETNRHAFSLPMAELSDRELRAFALGNRNFNLRWVSAPASALDVDGLGPTFVQSSCSACHLRDGRGAVPRNDGDHIEQAVIKLLPTKASDGKWLRRHVGDQLQTSAIAGVRPEAESRVRWRTHRRIVLDRSEVLLRIPEVELRSPRFRQLPQRARAQVLVAPAVFGLGLIEQIHSADILRLADPQDRDGDGISGRAHLIDSDDGTVLGRFGWKASVPNLREQIQLAAIGDMGLTSLPHPDENCPRSQGDCRRAAKGDSPDLSERFTDAIESYLRLLAVPVARTANSVSAQNGRRLFDRIGCVHCHRATFVTGSGGAHPVLSGRVIAPYSDFLLHDMGDELADGRTVGMATGSEWRTPPLWGLGLQATVNGHLQLLHDGRADGVLEAILWHGGEGATARLRFEALSSDERRDLVAFVRSL
jgi:CxxC motif-containing protein (DUF1111 family)